MELNNYIQEKLGEAIERQWNIFMYGYHPPIHEKSTFPVKQKNTDYFDTRNIS